MFTRFSTLSDFNYTMALMYMICSNHKTRQMWEKNLWVIYTGKVWENGDVCLKTKPHRGFGKKVVGKAMKKKMDQAKSHKETNKEAKHNYQNMEFVLIIFPKNERSALYLTSGSLARLTEQFRFINFFF